MEVDVICKFGEGISGPTLGKEGLGGKGYHLVDMCNLGLNVPKGIIITTDECVNYMNASENKLLHGNNKTLQVNEVTSLVMDELHSMFGEESNWPLLSVRSGARVSMPGMMNTVLNVGITPQDLFKWEDKLGKRLALDCYRRLIQMYGNVVHSMPLGIFESILKVVKDATGIKYDHEIPSNKLISIVKLYLKRFQECVYIDFPDTIEQQLRGSIKAVWDSWNSERATTYRKINNIPDDWGTAVVIQQMVFGNRNDKSCSGVMFTRNPATGDDNLYGEYLVNAQGEDVVSGVRTPKNIHTMTDWNTEIYEQIKELSDQLEEVYKDMQDVEFTVDDGELYILQTRTGKRSSRAAFKIVHAFYDVWGISLDEVKKRLTLKDFIEATKLTIDPGFKTPPVTKGIPAGGGVVTGKAVFTNEEALACKEPCILLREETTPDDIAGMNASIGILTTTGGATSHAAVVARSMNKSCVVGAISAITDLKATNAKKVTSITIDGDTGSIWFEEVPTVATAPPELDLIINEIVDLKSVIPIGTRPEDTHTDCICIPVNFFGNHNLDGWGDAIGLCLEAGLSVYVDVNLNNLPHDEKIINLCGPNTNFVDPMDYLLGRDDLSTEVILIPTSKATHTVDTLLGSTIPYISEDIVLKLFGTMDTYIEVSVAMKKVGKNLPAICNIDTMLNIINTELTNS